MKFIQITDTHIMAPGGRLHQLSPNERLAACIADINRNHGDAALCLFTGDLADSGAMAAYRELGNVLAGLGPPFRLLIGNHDDRDNFRRAFPEAPRDEHGFVQSVVRATAGDLILLDTVEAGRHDGVFCAARADWLAGQLDEAGDGPVYIFMHHPPFDIGIPSLDRIRLADPEAFVRAIEGRGNLRHIFFGHVHRPVSGSWRGIPFSALRGTAHQVVLDFHTESPIPKIHEPPAYAVILLEAERTVVHLHDYLSHAPIEGAVSPPPPE
jgi:3',5'-cyclic AMP phosphodiesterase CpdA